MKKVSVQMSDEMHAVLKTYATFFDVTMSEAMADWANVQLHKLSQHCEITHAAMKSQGIQPDKRLNKPCWGWQCTSCAHHQTCKVGLYDGLFEMSNRCKAHLRSCPYDKDWNGNNS